jgi:proteic killer suppression protein
LTHPGRNGTLQGEMEVRFDDVALDALEIGAGDGGFPPAVVKAFRKRIQYIRDAADIRDFYSMKSLHFEKLKGDLSGVHSMRLNDQWRLILKIEGDPPRTAAVLIGIRDYH